MDIEKFNNGHGARLILSSQEETAAKLVHNYLPPEEEARRADEIKDAEHLIEAAAADLARRYPEVKSEVILALSRALPQFPNPEYSWARTDGASVLAGAFSKEQRRLKKENGHQADVAKDNSSDISHGPKIAAVQRAIDSVNAIRTEIAFSDSDIIGVVSDHGLELAEAKVQSAYAALGKEVFDQINIINPAEGEE